MSHVIPSNTQKPNRLDAKAYPDKDNNEQYHIDYANYALSNAYSAEHSLWLEKTKINKRFYKGDQWILEEDTEAFLLDVDGCEQPGFVPEVVEHIGGLQTDHCPHRD